MIDWPAVITALGALVTAIGAILIGYWSYRAKERATAAATTSADNKKEIVQVKGDVFMVGERIDGRLTKLLELTEKAAFQAGKLEGIQFEQARVKIEIEPKPPPDPA